MSFWAKNKQENSKTKNSSSKKNKNDAIVAVEPRVKTSLDESLQTFSAKADRVFAGVNLESVNVVPMPILKTEETPTIPKDSFSLQLYIALNAAKVSETTYLQFIRSLEKRNSLESRLKTLNIRIARLTEDIKAREAVFEDAKFEDHLSDLDEDNDETESLEKNIMLNEELHDKREAFKESFVLLTQLEMNRVRIHNDLIGIFSEFNHKLPFVNDDIVNKMRQKIQQRIHELEDIENVSISDGEKNKEETALTVMDDSFASHIED